MNSRAISLFVDGSGTLETLGRFDPPSPRLRFATCATHGAYSIEVEQCPRCRLEAAEAEVRAELRRLFPPRAPRGERNGSAGGLASAARARQLRAELPTMPCACGGTIYQDRATGPGRWRERCDECRVKRKKEQDRESKERKKRARA